MKDLQKKLLRTLHMKTNQGNIDNISRTLYYERFYFFHPEIKWALLASLVSRNAGWNMCRLEGEIFAKLLTKEYRQKLFLTFERANWEIFRDAYPQLLLYHYSTILQRPMFHILRNFNVSNFMIEEWNHFWQSKDEERLLFSLIINEQNLIQKPVITNTFYQKNVFQSFPFRLQDYFHYSIVIFPTILGEVYGVSVSNFLKVDSRIEVGKRLSRILFHKELHNEFIKFIKTTPPTGSSLDYQRFMDNCNNYSPPLRLTYSIVHHPYRKEPPWDRKKRVKQKWFHPPKFKEEINITNWYKEKEKELEVLLKMAEWLNIKA